MVREYQDAPSRNSTQGAPTGTEIGSPRGRPRSDKVNRAILDAARELLIRDGYTRLRLEHVAAHAGVGKATIYRRWESKEKLAQALLADLASPHIGIEDTGDTREEMLAAVMNPVRAITESEFGPVIRALLSQIAINPALGDPFRATVVQARRDEIGLMIVRGIARGDLCPDADPQIATELLVGPVYFRLMFGGELDREFAERIVDNVMRGYGMTIRDVAASIPNQGPSEA
jgi:AcrR family transcriptional regulator